MAASEEEAMAAVVEGEDGIVWEELPAPPGWKKKVAQRRGGTPRRGDVTFVAADGEEIKSKRQLERYLKANSGGPSIAEFDWGTGETPRRSERLSSRKRSSDFEPEPTTPRRGRKKKAAPAAKEEDAAAAATAAAKEAEENGKEEENPKAEAAAAAAADEAKDKDGEKEAPAAGDEDQAKKGAAVKASAPGPSPSPTPAAAPAPVSCAKTETMAKSQETQPAQIGVSS